MKKVLYTVTILFIGVLIGMTTTTMAEPAKEFVQATFAKIKFVVNGEEKQLDADPLVYQGSTYLPVRSVLNALGYDAGYKADTKTVTADKSDNNISPESNTTPKEEQAVEPNSNENEQIKSLQNSIQSAKEVISNLETGIEQVKNDQNLDDKKKEEMIASYKSRIEQFSKNIKTYETKISELQK